MNPIDYALDRIIRFDIPKQILQVAFLSRYALNHSTLDTLKQKMREEVIEPRICVDCNLLHGTEMTIPLAMCEKLTWTYYETVYRVPKSLTQGKNIISPIELTASAGATMPSTNTMSSTTGGLYGNNTAAFSGMGASVAAAVQMQRSVTPIRSVSNALLYLVGDNTILFKDAVIVPASMQIRVMVENDENFNHIQPPYYPDFYELVSLAVQMYIYRTLVIEQDSVFIASGGELNRFKDVVEEMSEARQLYKEQLDIWYKSALLNDPEASRRHYSGATGGLW